MAVVAMGSVAKVPVKAVAVMARAVTAKVVVG